jgi:hypothetical protein
MNILLRRQIVDTENVRKVLIENVVYFEPFFEQNSYILFTQKDGDVQTIGIDKGCFLWQGAMYDFCQLENGGNDNGK